MNELVNTREDFMFVNVDNVSFQMEKKMKYDVFRLLYTKLNMNGYISIIYGNVIHESDKDIHRRICNFGY